jgi:ArsR family transcriptional regulator
LPYIVESEYRGVVELLKIYQCLCDATRLRILNLLAVSPLCVCHMQQVLGKSQVIVSQHLAYLRERGMVAGRRYQQWMIYALPPAPPPELEANLKCLQDCVQTEPVFQQDRVRLQKLMGGSTVSALLEQGCCPKPRKITKSKRTNSTK